MSEKSVILCLDDDELVLVALEYQLQKRFGDRFIYEFALDPLEGLDVLSQLKDERCRLALVISDWLMPEMRGDEFLKKVDAFFPDTAKILLTGKTDETQAPLNNLEISSILYKPWDENQLFKQVEQALEESASK